MKKKSLLEALWNFWSMNCQYKGPYHIHSSTCDGKCKCTYFPKYILGGKKYGKLYRELEKVNALCECKRREWWERHTKTRTFETCPMLDYLKQENGIKGGGKYYKEMI